MSQALQLLPLIGFSIVATIGFYGASQILVHRFRWFIGAYGLGLSAGGILMVLYLTGLPYSSYKAGGDWLTFMLGPATVALAVPLHKNALLLQGRLPLVLGSVAAGCCASIVVAGVLMLWLGGSGQAALSMMPKSATAAISMEISRQIGGAPELTAVLTALTGWCGAMVGPPLLRCLGMRHDIVIGVAVGTAAHGIGTAQVARESGAQGSASTLAMALGGLTTSLVFMVLQWLL